MKIVLPGGSGQVGAILARSFHAAGHEVVVLSRTPQRAPWRTRGWDAESPGDLAVTVNDEPTQAQVAPGSVTVLLPPGVADAWVTFTSTSGGSPLLRVRSIRVVPTGTG